MNYLYLIIQQVLQLLSPTIERDECSTAFQEENMAKNRFKNILPGKLFSSVVLAFYDNSSNLIIFSLTLK